MFIKRNELRRLITEAIYGNMATVYHGSRTPPAELIKSYNEGGFQPGGGAGGLYGMGLYTVYDDEDLFVSNTGTGKYGEYVYKFKTNLNNFLCLNEDTCALIHKKVLTVREQLEKIKGLDIQIKDIERSNYGFLLDEPLDKKNVLTGSKAKKLSEYLMNDIVGMLFRGSNDGYVCLIFNDSNTYPIGHSTASEIQAAGEIKNINWEKIDKTDIENVIKRSAITSAQPGKFMKNNLRDRSSAYGMSELELTNVEVFTKRYESIKDKITINPDTITKAEYYSLKNKLLSSLSRDVTNDIRVNQYKKYALESMLFEKSIESASTLQGILNTIEFDDLLDDVIIGDRFGTELTLHNKTGEKIYRLINTKYKNADIKTISNILSNLNISNNLASKINSLYNSVNGFNVITMIITTILNMIRGRASSVDMLVFLDDSIKIAARIGNEDASRILANEIPSIFESEAEIVGKDAANKINAGESTPNAVYNAMNSNKFFKTVMMHIGKASKELNEKILNLANYHYYMSGVTKSTEYAMLLVLIETFKLIDKTKALEAGRSVSDFSNYIPNESIPKIVSILREKMNS